MSHDEVLACRITEDAYKTFRMLTYSVVYLAVLASPVVVLAAIIGGWKLVEAYLVIHN